MFTRNYNNLIIRALLAGANWTGVPAGYESGKLGYKRNNGNLYNINASYTPTFPSLDNWQDSAVWGIDGNVYNGVSGANSMIWIGTGDTPESYEDYTLANPLLTTTIQAGTHIVGNLLYDSENKLWYKEVTRTFSNISSEDITIKEMCVMHSLISSSSNYPTAGLIYRKVFSEPINLPVNESVNITFRFEIPENLLGIN